MGAQRLALVPQRLLAGLGGLGQGKGFLQLRPGLGQRLGRSVVLVLLLGLALTAGVQAQGDILQLEAQLVLDRGVPCLLYTSDAADE